MAQSGRKHAYLAWLVCGALAAALLLAWLQTKRSVPSNAELTRLGARDAELQGRLQHLERQLSQLKSHNQVLTARSGRAVSDSDVGESVAAAKPVQREQPAIPDEPELSEELMQERAMRRADERYLLLEQRFAAEPLDGAGATLEERTARERSAALQGYELSKIECRYTMCRLEVKADSPSPAGVMSDLGFTEGGEIRRRPDGTFLMFAGREGFPFHELNRGE